MTGNGQANYVNYGAMVNTNVPFLCNNTRLYGFLVEGDLDKLKALCKKVFSDPTQGGVTYIPLTHYVLLAYADVGAVSSAEPPLNKVGSVNERQVATWVLTAAVKREAGVLVAQRIAWFVPYIIVDNPASLTGGREVYGYPKSFGWFDLNEDDVLHELAVDIFGGDFGPKKQAGRHRLLEVTGIDTAEGPKVNKQWQTMSDAHEELKEVLWDIEDGQIIVPGLHLAEDLFEDITKHEILQVFLKQFRSATESPGACYQDINEVRSRVTRFGGMSLLNKYKLTLHALDSHPITKELGVGSQDVTLSYVLDMDFTQGTSNIVWQWGAEPERKGCLPFFGR